MNKKISTENNVTTNRQAYRDYFILDKIEAGIVLIGCEVKSLRETEANLAGSFARFDGSQLFVHNLYIAPYVQGNRENPDPLRPKQLLLHHNELLRMAIKVKEKGLTLVPLRVYFNARGIAKLEIALAKGKKLYDRRADIRKDSAKRDIARAVKAKNRQNAK